MLIEHTKYHLLLLSLNHQLRIAALTITLHPTRQARQQAEQQPAQHHILRPQSINELTADRCPQHAAHIGRRQKEAIGKVRGFRGGTGNPILIDTGIDAPK